MSEKFEFPKDLDECKTLSFDEADEYLDMEEEAGLDVKARRKMTQWVIKTVYGEDVFEEIKGCNRKVTDLFSLITTATFGLSSEVKNCVRSGNGDPTQAV